ncbi:MAG TPA: DNA repair protein RecO [Firmicutes bacterium]|jgi:DNA repair protein RecO (recombination protein O)|nr:DNA repair protein RecO [Bacillota bacterium]
MPLYRIEAVVLSHRYLGEADKIVTLYSREKGKVRAVARGARRPRNRLLAGTQPYSHTDFLLFSGNGLDSISQCELKESFYSLREDLRRMAAAAYVAELYDLLIEEGENNEGLFFLLLSTLHLLTDGEEIELSLRYFELRFLSLLGYQPQLFRCVHCGSSTKEGPLRFSGQLGGVLCPDCWGQDGRAVSLAQGTVEMLKRFLTTSPRALRVFKAGPSARRELAAALRACLEYRLPRELKSRRFLALVQGDGF